MWDNAPAKSNARDGELAGLRRLLQRSGGVFSSLTEQTSTFGEPRFVTSLAHSGDLSRLRDISAKIGGNFEQRRISLIGSGVDLETASTVVPALAEGLERYATTMYRKQQFVWATADELGENALDLDTIPRCSEAELADPKCPLVRPSKTERIRWVSGVCLRTGTIRQIPASLVYVFFPATAPERLCMQITTGCAAHRSYPEALLGGLLEVIERDAIALTWLQMLPLPRVEVTSVPAALAPYLERSLAASRHLEHSFFNATTDVGVPVIYGVERCYADPRLTTIVCCAAALHPVEALTKVMRDIASVRTYLGQQPSPPDDLRDFCDLPHGASFMARAEQASAFDFLTNSSQTVTLDAIAAFGCTDVAEALRRIVQRLHELEMEVFAVDLTTDEALRAGMRVVRVLVPGLQPFAFHYRARYLGHPRLGKAPAAMGYPSREEGRLNPYPQPFA